VDNPPKDTNTMTIEQKTDVTTETKQLEAAAQNAQTALDEFNEAHTFRYPQPSAMAWNTTVERNKLANAVAATKRALEEEKKVQHNQAIYADILTNYTANQARIAAEKAAQAAQQAGVNEEQFKEKALQAYLAAGGTNLGFAGEWPTLRAELVRQKTLAALSGAKPTSLVDEYIQRRNG
jgi:ribosomal protein S20